MKVTGPVASTSGADIIDEALAYYRANVLFRTFEVKGPSDKLLVYLTLYIGYCLKSKLFCWEEAITTTSMTVLPELASLKGHSM